MSTIAVDVVYASSTSVPLLVLHGQLFDRRALRACVRAAAPDRSVAFVDLPWHGDSRHDDGGFDVFGAAVLSVCDRLGFGQVHLVGHSLGALVAVHLGAQAPARVAAQTLIAPPLSFSDEDRAQSRALAPLLAGGMTRDLATLASSLWLSQYYRDTHPDHVDTIAALLAGNDPAAAARCALALGSVPSLPAAFAPKTTVVLMQDDTQVPLSRQEPLARQRGAEVVVLPGGHLPQLEQPEALRAALASIFSRS